MKSIDLLNHPVPMSVLAAICGHSLAWPCKYSMKKKVKNKGQKIKKRDSDSQDRLRKMFNVIWQEK